VRSLAAIALLVTATADARPVPRRYRPTTADPDRTFWRELVEPHADVVRNIVSTAKQILSQSDSLRMGDYERQPIDRHLQDVYAHLRYARELAPQNVDVLVLLGQCADELGKTTQAQDALEAAIAIVGTDRASVAVVARLGAIYLRLGRIDDAIRYLQLAQLPITPGNAPAAHALVHLARAFAERDRMNDGIDLLQTAIATPSAYVSNESTLVTFALVVTLDRDDQRGAAFEVFERLEGQLQGALAAQVQQAMSTVRFAPAEDEHYWRALLYEVSGSYAEARTEWSLYAASDGRWRRRALEHVAAIDAERRAPRKPNRNGAVIAPQPPVIAPVPP
jgi:tetratricopeptide (TPR) repeat protein